MKTYLLIIIVTFISIVLKGQEMQLMSQNLLIKNSIEKKILKEGQEYLIVDYLVTHSSEGFGNDFLENKVDVKNYLFRACVLPKNLNSIFSHQFFIGQQAILYITADKELVEIYSIIWDAKDFDFLEVKHASPFSLNPFARDSLIYIK
jgi:hypothetical protein